MFAYMFLNSINTCLALLHAHFWCKTRNTGLTPQPPSKTQAMRGVNLHKAFG
jgi:hypothetical protein